MDDKTKLEDNENQTTVGMTNVYPTPAGREPGTISAKWGDQPPPKGEYPDHYGTGALREAREDRHGVLERVFDGMNQASAAAKAEVAQHFDTKDYQSHSPLLHKQKTAARLDEHAPAEESLSDKVRRVIG